MLTALGGEILATLIAALLSFIAGVLFTDPIKRGVERLRRWIQFWKRKPTPVRIFLILFPLPSDRLIQLLLRQNRLQTLFQLEVAEWQTWSGHGAAEAHLRALQTNSRLEFAERFQNEM